MLNSLSSYYQIRYICDVSQKALEHCSKKVAGGIPPQTTSSPEELISSPHVDVVIICNVNAFHPAHAILALQRNKYVFVEKPLALNYRDLDAIIAAEKNSEARVFVGYQRRYAEAFLDALEEVGSMDKIEYIRVRGMTSGRRICDFGNQEKSDLEEQILLGRTTLLLANRAHSQGNGRTSHRKRRQKCARPRRRWSRQR